MSEVILDVIPLEEGKSYTAFAGDFLITEKHSIADILRFCMSQLNDTDTSHLKAILDTM